MKYIPKLTLEMVLDVFKELNEPQRYFICQSYGYKFIHNTFISGYELSTRTKIFFEKLMIDNQLSDFYRDILKIKKT